MCSYQASTPAATLTLGVNTAHGELVTPLFKKHNHRENRVHNKIDKM